MILRGYTTELERKVARGRFRHLPPRRKLVGGQRRAERVKKNGVAT